MQIPHVDFLIDVGDLLLTPSPGLVMGGRGAGGRSRLGGRAAAAYARVALSITKRYLTSLFSIRS